METESTQTISREQKVHQFYCDGCGAELGTSVELDDGYYKTFGDYQQGVYVNKAWYRLKKNFCDECATAKTAAIISALTGLGFVLE